MGIQLRFGRYFLRPAIDNFNIKVAADTEGMHAGAHVNSDIGHALILVVPIKYLLIEAPVDLYRCEKDILINKINLTD